MERGKQLNEFVQLCEAIEKGNEDAARQLILSKAEIDLNYRSSSNTLLHWAIIKFQGTEVIKMLLNKKANIHAKNHRRQSPLDLAVHLNKVDAVELLLNEGAYPRKNYESLVYKATTKGSETVVKILVDYGVKEHSSINLKKSLDFAVKRGYSKIVEYIIPHCKFNKLSDKWISVNAVSSSDQQFKDCIDILFKYGFTINPRCLEDADFIFSAVNNGYTPVVKEFMRLGFNQNLADKVNGHTLLYSACLNRHFQIAEIIIEYMIDGSVSLFDQTNYLIYFAVSGARYYEMSDYTTVNKISTLLIKKGADVNALDPCGGTPLFTAIQENYFEMVKVLLEQNADVQHRDNDGKSPLHIAAIMGDPRIVNILLDYNAQVNITQNIGQTPLHDAASQGHVDIVQALLDHNAEVDAADINGSTPLHFAAVNGNVEITRILLKNGADANVKADDGHSSLHLAASYGHSETVQILLDHNAEVDGADINGSTPLHFAAVNGNVEITRILLKNGADTNVKADGGHSSLHLAAYHGHSETVQVLLDHNAEINAINNNGHTPFHSASIAQKTDIIRMLLEKNADATVIDKKGRTALHFISQGTQEWIPNIIKLLLQFNVDVDYNHNDESGKSPIYIAEHVSKNHFTLKSFMEIGQLKMKKVGESNITFYNILKKNIHSVSKYINNEDIVKTLELEIYDEMFSLSIDIIRNRFTEAILRSRLLKIAHEQSYSSILHGLPHNCVDEVFSYLKTGELECFIEAIRLSENSTN